MSIYKDLILDHYKNPRYRGELKKYTIKKVSINPSCGDQITFYILIKDNVIKEVSYTSTGCVISQAAASIIAEKIINKKLSEIDKMSQQELLDLMGIDQYSARTKCALLPLETIKKIL